MLFTGEPLTATEAASLGMVNRVVEREALDSSTVALAEKIAQRPPFGLRLAKASVNQALEAQGQHTGDPGGLCPAQHRTCSQPGPDRRSRGPRRVCRHPG